MSRRIVVEFLGKSDQLSKTTSGVEKSFGKVGDKLSDLGKKAGLALGAVTGVVAAMALDAEKSGDKLAAQLGLTAKESERIGKVSGSLYANAYGDSLDHVNQAVGAVMTSIKGMSNRSSEQLERVTAKALDFAAAFEVDVARASQVAGQLIETGLAKNAVHAFDLLTAASQKVPAALREDVLDATDEYGQFFATLGYDGNQAFSLLVDASKKGMFGIDKAGDALKEFTIRATDMSKASAGSFKAIGLDQRKMADAILKGGDDAQGATQKIIDGLLAIESPSKRANAAIGLFGTPLEDLNVKDIPKFLKSMKGMSGSMDDAAGASKRVGDTLNDNTTTHLTVLGRTIKTAAIDKFNEFAGVLLKKVGPAVEKHKGLVTTLAFGAAVLAAAVYGIHLAMRAWVVITKVWTAVTKVATVVMKAFNLVMRANPIGLVITAVALVAAGLVFFAKKTEIGRKITAKMWAGLKQLGSWLASAGKRAWDVITAGVEKFAKVGIWMWNNVYQPVFRFLVRGIATIMDMWAKMLRSLAKVPGFGWAGKAADAMQGAANKARGLADDVRKIPTSKTIKFNADTSAARYGLESFIRSASGRYISIGTRVRATGGVTARAHGGPVRQGYPYLVGEREPELFVPNSSGRILNQRQMAAAGSSGGGSGEVARFEIPVVVDGRVIQRSLLTLKRRNGGLELGIA